MKLRILFSDPDQRYVIVDKPSGFYTHPPESGELISAKLNAMAILRDQLGEMVYPVHRLDRATSGCVLYARSSEAAGALGKIFQRHEVSKHYLILVRGWVTEKMKIDSPLADDRGIMRDATTQVTPLHRIELPEAISKFSTMRLTLCQVEIGTGRFHQIRRHLKRMNHPLIGDSLYGDGKYNARWKEKLGKKSLFLKAYRLRFSDPWHGGAIECRSRYQAHWHRLFDWLGVCPYL